MGYDRYESRRGWRDPRGRFSDDFRDRDERGFFERAGDEVASWLGKDKGERPRKKDARRFDEEGGRRPRTSSGDEDFSRFDRQPRFPDEGYRRPHTARLFGRGGFGRAPDRGFGPNRGWSQDRWTPERKRDFSGAASGLHDPHYSEWRQRQLDGLDRDYDDYRRENQS